MVPSRSYSGIVSRTEFLEKVSFIDKDIDSLNDYPILSSYTEKKTKLLELISRGLQSTIYFTMFFIYNLHKTLFLKLLILQK